MLYLNTDTANQTLRLSLNEGRMWLATFTNYLIVLQHTATRQEYYLVADVVSENDRYTEITVGTDDDDGANSSVLITNAGQYIYTVYGQNSATNLDPENAAVVGIVERGFMQINLGISFVTETTTTLPNAQVISES